MQRVVAFTHRPPAEQMVVSGYDGDDPDHCLRLGGYGSGGGEHIGKCVGVLLFDRLRARATLALNRLYLPPALRHTMTHTKPYTAWCDVNRLTPAATSDLLESLDELAEPPPRISVIMPVHRPNAAHFVAAVASVKSQILDNWQLCICDDGSNEPELTRELADLAAGDIRIAVTALAHNQGISAATNAAAALGTGEIFLFLDQDDILAPDCIAEFALAFGGQPECDLAYSDSDKLDAKHGRYLPSFKPGWSPTLLLSHMYLSHAVAIRRDLFVQLGGARAEFDGSQDYDLALRASEKARAIRHIPRILYHWRIVSGSTALSASAKPYSIDAGRRALGEALIRRGIAAAVDRPEWAKRANIGLFELRFTKIPAALSLVIVVPDGTPVAADHLHHLLAEAAKSQVILALPAGAIPAPKMDSVTIIRAAAGETLASRMIEAASKATGTQIVFVSGDLSPTSPGWLAQLCGHAALPGIGMAGARILNSDGRVRHVGMVYPDSSTVPEAAFAGYRANQHGPLYLARVTRETRAIHANCIALPRHLFSEAGLAAPLDRWTDIGIALSSALRDLGHSILACASAELIATGKACAGKARLDTLTGPANDPWYNHNLGSKEAQFRPTPRCPALRSRRPVRLAVVTHNLDREGAQNTLLDLISGLAEAGVVAPFVISPRDGPLRREFDRHGIPVEILDSPPRRACGRQLADYRAALTRSFASSGAQAILANTLECHAAIGAAAEAGIGSIWWQHEGGSWNKYFRHLPPTSRARAFAAFGQAYRVVQVAQATRQAWLPLSTRGNFELVRHGIPTELLEAHTASWTREDARRSLGLADDDICVLLLGSICRRKGQEDIVKALSVAALQASKPIRAFIAGAFVEPRYRSRLETLLTRLPLGLQSRISLVGAVTETARYYAAADIFVCCSRQESAPRTLVEAMAFGLPIITTAVDGIPELVCDGWNGLFYRPGDFRHLQRLILQLATSHEERQRLGLAGQGFVPKISDCSTMIARLGALVRQAAWAGASNARQGD